MYSARPVVTPSPAPGNWRLWVTSKIDRVAQFAHHRQRAHVDHQVVVAERRCRARSAGCRWRRLSVSLAATCRMSRGARNCALLDVDGPAGPPPRRRSRSVCRDRKAGIWSTSATSAAGAACAARGCRSGSAARCALLTAAESLQAIVAGPARGTSDSEVRLALSNDALKTSGTPARRATLRPGERHVEHMPPALDHAGPEDEAERVPAARRSRAPPARAGRPCGSGQCAGFVPPDQACRASAGRRRRRSWRTAGAGAAGARGTPGGTAPPMNHGWPGSSAISTNLPSGERPEMSIPRSLSAGS